MNEIEITYDDEGNEEYRIEYDADGNIIYEGEIVCWA
tara:strand:+ start:446 stop:556 length:111 start_codon:yes stop_codon:yes gene_type:complete